MQNGYSSATGQQFIPSSINVNNEQTASNQIEKALKSVGVKWMKTVRTYSVDVMLKTLREAMETNYDGLKVIIADGECMLARQRRIKKTNAKRLAKGQKVAIPRFGVDEEICTGDHSLSLIHI